MKPLDNLNDLLKKQVTRREFLTHIGLAVISLLGISGMLKNLNKSLETKDHKAVSDQGGYGYGTYSDSPPQNSTKKI